MKKEELKQTIEMLKTVINIEEWRKINAVIRNQYNTICFLATCPFDEGDNVEFTSRSGKIVKGVIQGSTNRRRKTLLINTPQGTCKVTSTLVRLRKN